MSAATAARGARATPSALTTAPQLKRRKARASFAHGVFLAATASAGLVLLALLAQVVTQGWDGLGWNLLTENISQTANRIEAKEAGYFNGIISTLWIVFIAGVFAIPVGIGAAVYLEEYAAESWFTRIVQTNIANLAGVPSVVYGLLGLGVLVNFFGAGRFLGASVISGGLTLGLLVLPIVIISSQEAIRAVPLSLRQAGFALGATPWQVARHHVLPAATPGILTGTILAVARAVGETAPVLVAGAFLYITYVPNSPTDGYSPLPVQVFNLLGNSQEAFREFASAGIILMMVLLLLLNGVAIVLRERASRRVRW